MFAAIIVIGLGGAGWWQLGGGDKEPPYVTTPVQRASIIQVVSSTGTLQAVVTVQVGSQVSGTIEKLFADFNTKVKAGQIVAQLNKSIAQALHAPDVQEKLSSLGMEAVGNSTQEAAKYIAAEAAKWSKVAKAANIRAD